MEYKVYKENNYTIHAIKTDKFRNCVMEIIFTQEIDKKKTTSRTFLNDLLCFTSEKYKTRRELTIELENLYSSYVRCNSFRYGNRAFTSFYTSFLDPKYCEEGYLEDIIHLPFELLFRSSSSCAAPARPRCRPCPCRRAGQALASPHPAARRRTLRSCAGRCPLQTRRWPRADSLWRARRCRTPARPPSFRGACSSAPTGRGAATSGCRSLR